MVQIEFKNSGNTIHDEDVDMIMEPFFRAGNVVNQKGYGLGLSIAKRIVELHKGRLYYRKEEHLNIFMLELRRS